MSVFLQHKEMLLKNDSLNLKSKKQLYKITAKDLVAHCLDCCVIIKQKVLVNSQKISSLLRLFSQKERKKERPILSFN